MKKSATNLFRAVTLAGALVASLPVSTDAAAADGCPAGTTKKAVKTFGSSAYASPCRIATCKTIGTAAVLTHVNLSTMTVVFDYLYTATAGTAPAVSCRSEVSNDIWQ